MPTQSAKEHSRTVIGQRRLAGRKLCWRRDGQRFAVQLIITPAIVIIRSEPVPNYEAKVLVHGDVATVEQSVQVRAEAKSISERVLPAVCAWTNVGCIQNWE